jgi:transposase
MDDLRLLFGITSEDWARTPASVQEAYRTLLDVVSNLEARVQLLEAQLRQTSRNSSKPPSSDPPSAPPPPSRVPRGRKRGAQAGHADQQRPLVPPEQADQIVVLHPQQCPDCQTLLRADLPDAEPPQRHQVWELVPRLVQLTEYQRHIVDCPTCGQLLIARLPDDFPPGVCGPQLTALIGLLHGRYRLSTRETAAFLAEVAGVELSTGSIITSCTRVSDALAPVDAAIAEHIHNQDILWVDETSWREQQQRGWLWVAVSPRASCFRIESGRSQVALRRLLGDGYRGLVHSDRGSAYHLLPSAQRQLCWAHLVRNLQGLIDQQHSESPRAGGMLQLAHQLFAAWRWYRNGMFDQLALQQALIPVRLAMQERLEAGRRCGWDKLEGLCRDLLTHWEALWTFSRVEGMQPTNNVAERALRPAVVWRKSCFGTQSAVGSRFVERMLSVRATCAQQGRNLFAFLTEAVRAQFASQPAPSVFVSP